MPSRRVFQITGSEAEEFLQGLVTNDISRLDPDQTGDGGGLVYAALLTPQGKYIADFFLARQGGAILLDVDEALADALAKRLSMYKLRADVAISDSGLQVQRGTGPAPEGAFRDPRHAALGWRAYSEAPESDDGTDWTALRVAHCIPETGIELTPDTFILEAGFERLNGVDFRKGCYVGQEVTARMKHKTELRKGLARVAVAGQAAPGTEILAGEKAAGTLLSTAGDKGIAYLRFDRVAPEMQAGDARVSLDPVA
ncbi:CAF17-like 4Fe-4S cluster assembly/insertion protein YgfZ [Marinibacterium profundimaris]|uniref:Aminomethyltransferase n=1 Tax=Marinibacterium profundimaris TaxID=1679460 RepID=A0A225NFW4_9RHOB|nr:folate-binding protein YgfZ [Marinibacterium profundimaris]OWU72455.1 aminomethyltransferase [Marinibacterium profundimaris]